MASASLYVQYRSRAIDGNRSAKVLQGTLADLRNDFRACFEGGSTMPTSDLNLNSGPGEQAIAERFLDFSANESERAIHFVGRSNAMLLLREGLNARFAGVGQEYSSNHGHIVWLAPSVQSVRLPRSQLDGRVTQHDYRVPSDQRALHRAEVVVDAGGTFPPTNRGRKSSVEQWSANEYVDRIKFRYFDGTQWIAEWDSHLRNETIPSAVELTLALSTNPEQPFRFVIRLPGASGSSLQLRSDAGFDERSGQ